MAIVIKKRSPVPPETPVVEGALSAQPVDPVPAQDPGLVRGTTCEFCRHVYIKPCHGQNAKCMNFIFKTERLKKQAAASGEK